MSELPFADNTTYFCDGEWLTLKKDDHSVRILRRTFMAFVVVNSIFLLYIFGFIIRHRKQTFTLFTTSILLTFIISLTLGLTESSIFIRATSYETSWASNFFFADCGVRFKIVSMVQSFCNFSAASALAYKYQHVAATLRSIIIEGTLLTT